MHSQIINLGLLSLASLAVAVPMPQDGRPTAIPSCAGEWVFPSGTYRYNRHRNGARPSCVLSGSATATQEALATAAPASEAPAAVTSAAALSSDADVDSTVFASSAESTAAASVDVQENRVRPGTTTAANVATTTTASTPATSSSTSSSGSSGGKRGVAFNAANLVSPFIGQAPVSWSYNWGSKASGLGSGIEYVPMLWSDSSEKTASWDADAKAAIAAGATALLGFNEPDHPEQANMAVSKAASSYKSLISDKFGGSSVKLGSPAVTNGGAPMGLDYLSNFLKACSDCQVDFVNIHWYDSASNVDYFKSHVKQAHDISGKPVWITEFGATGSDADVNTFLKTVLPWLDQQDYVQRYSYFMAAEGKLISGGKLSTYGTTFASFTG
jgi:hypothetical protein